MKCKDCPHFWIDEDPNHSAESSHLPACHYMYNDGYAPCETDEKELETEDM